MCLACRTHAGAFCWSFFFLTEEVPPPAIDPTSPAEVPPPDASTEALPPPPEAARPAPAPRLLASPAAPPRPLDEVAERPPPEVRGTHPIWEMVGLGTALFAGSWVANWITSIAVGLSDGLYVGTSFIPIAGPWVQLTQLEWAVHPRWTGAFHPVIGSIQVTGLVLLVVGATITVPNASPRPTAGDWRLVPLGSHDGAGARFELAF